MKKIYILILFFILISMSGQAQNKLSVNGYVKYMEMVSFQELDSMWITNSLIYYRFDISYFPTDYLNAQLSVRNRFYFGEMVTFSQPPFNALFGTTGAYNFIDETEYDAGFFNLSHNLLKGDSYFFNTSIDRAFVKFQKGNWEVSAGRQRINWGQSFVWNPNDIFNAYSYFDFDYEEKPGSDAFRAQYYLDFASRIEVAAAVNRDTNVTAAAFYQFNKWQYDVQVLAGIFNSKDYVAGIGWSGNIWNAAFRGEMSYFHSIKNPTDSSGTFIASVGSDYSFKNGSMIQAEIMFNSAVDSDIAFNLSDFYTQRISAKNLSYNRWTFFSSFTYPVTPLINLSFSGMYSPQNQFVYIGPSCGFSISDSFLLDITLQSFFSEIPTDEGGGGTYAFLRGKWSF
jgi:hypothetical protein